MSTQQEFHYRLSRRVGGHRPGAHAGTSVGTGLEFAAHMNLFDRPDPRRLDVRASLRSNRDAWLVRVSRQRAGIAVHALVDVSASMSFGAPRSKLHIAAEFVEALGLSAFRMGDLFGMLAFDSEERTDLYAPARLSRGASTVAAEKLRALDNTRAGVAGLEQVAARVARQGLVFLVSDFHFPLPQLAFALEFLALADVVPVVIWDEAETEPLTRNAIAPLEDVESGSRRTLWMRPSLRARWRTAVEMRRAEIEDFFASRSIRPFFIEDGRFDPDAMSRYFFEAV